MSEGSGVTLSAAATDTETPNSLTYSWDLNGDETPDATGANVWWGRKNDARFPAEFGLVSDAAAAQR